MGLVRLQWGFALLSAIGLLGFVHPAHAAVSYNVGVCDPKASANCIKPNSDGSINVTGTFSLTNYALETGGNLAASKADLDALVAAAANPAAIFGVNGTGIATAANPFPVRNSDGTNQITIKAASTGAATTDTAQVVALSPNPSPVCTSSLAINQTSSTDLVTSVAKINICSVVLVSATAQNISLVEGTNASCAAGQQALIGGTTASVAVAANGGFSAVADRTWLKTKTAADHLCLFQSGAGNVSGVITYADAA